MYTQLPKFCVGGALSGGTAWRVWHARAAVPLLWILSFLIIVPTFTRVAWLLLSSLAGREKKRAGVKNARGRILAVYMLYTAGNCLARERKKKKKTRARKNTKSVDEKGLSCVRIVSSHIRLSHAREQRACVNGFPLCFVRAKSITFYCSRFIVRAWICSLSTAAMSRDLFAFWRSRAPFFIFFFYFFCITCINDEKNVEVIFLLIIPSIVFSLCGLIALTIRGRSRAMASSNNPPCGLISRVSG